MSHNSYLYLFYTQNLNASTDFWVEMNQGTCKSARKKITATTNALPATPVINISKAAYCEGDSIHLSTPNTATKYSWTGASGFTESGQNPIRIATTQAGTQGIYTLIITDTKGCQSLPATKNVVVYPRPEISTAPNVSVIDGGSVVLHATGGNTYTWFPTTNLDNPNIGDPTLTFPLLQTLGVDSFSRAYNVFAKNSFGCTGIAKVNISVRPQTIVKVYDVIILNSNSEINNKWQIDFLQHYEAYDIDVFDYFGNRVYQYLRDKSMGSHYHDNPWDGQYTPNAEKIASRAVINDTYYYIIRLKKNNAIIETLTGARSILTK
jgi:CHU_C Type IX secretion signal domain